MNDLDLERNTLRRQMKARRRALSAFDRSSAAVQFATQVQRMRVLRPHARVAVYSAVRGEADPTEIVRLARRLHCTVYLPVIVNRRTGRMAFVKVDAATPMRRHRWGFIEPAHRARVAVRALDVVLVPAVAVDERGMRIGAGAGFYDRLFHFRRYSRWRRPKLIALVYDFQRVHSLPAQPWDVPMDAALSESGLHPTKSDPQSLREGELQP